MMKFEPNNAIMDSLKKQSCLFGTVHIKAATAIITVFDLFMICQMDELLYTRRSTDEEYTFGFLLILLLLAAVFLAQVGLHRNTSWMLLPLVITHSVFTLAYFMAMGYQGFLELIYVIENHIHIGRLLMFVVYFLTIGLLKCYAVFILARTYIMFQDIKVTAPPMTVQNEVFDDKNDSEMLFFEKAKGRRIGSASPGPVNSPRRTVRFSNVFGP